MKFPLLILLSLTTALANTVKLDFNFKVKTNVPGLKVEGKLKDAVSAPVNSGEKITIPLNQLDTGLALRDSHMRDEVFKNQDPVITLVDVAQCQKDKDCTLPIKLSLAGTDKEVQVQLISKGKGKFSGEQNLKLSDFKIIRPTKMGVTVDDQVLVNFEVELK